MEETNVPVPTALPKKHIRYLTKMSILVILVSVVVLFGGLVTLQKSRFEKTQRSSMPAVTVSQSITPNTILTQTKKSCIGLKEIDLVPWEVISPAEGKWSLRNNKGEPIVLNSRFDNKTMTDHFQKVSNDYSLESFDCPENLFRVRNENKFVMNWESGYVLIDLDQQKVYEFLITPDTFPLNNVKKLTFHPKLDLAVLETGWEGPYWLEYIIDFSNLDINPPNALNTPVGSSMRIGKYNWTDQGVNLVATQVKRIEGPPSIPQEGCEKFMNKYDYTKDQGAYLNILSEQAVSLISSQYETGPVSCSVCSESEGHLCLLTTTAKTFSYKPGDNFIRLDNEQDWSGDLK